MSCICAAHVDNNSAQLIRKVVFFQVIALFLFLAVFFRVNSVVSHIEFLRKFELFIQLDPLHGVVVEVKPTENDQEIIRQRFN